MLSLSSQLKTLLAGGRFGATVIARSTLPSGVYAMCDSLEDLTWNGQAYQPMGPALVISVSPTTMVGKQQPASIRITYDVDSLSTILSENYRKAPTSISVLIKDLSTNTFIAEVPVFGGYLDTAKIKIADARIDQPDKPVLATLTFSVLPRSSKLDKVGVRVRSDADQRTHRDANDGFFKDVGLAAKSTINWGRAGPNSPAAVAGGGSAGSLGLNPMGAVNGALNRYFHQ